MAKNDLLNESCQHACANVHFIQFLYKNKTTPQKQNICLYCFVVLELSHYVDQADLESTDNSPGITDLHHLPGTCNLFEGSWAGLELMIL
ncbi:hypothetical protein H671_1g0515 [Cricetulus griseus]|nr:hypothetical protein H671_1g0515 [Cricetulus griseus]